MTDASPERLLLSAAQEGIWRGQQLLPCSPLYNAAECIALPGQLDEAAFEAALRAALFEAEALGARYEDDDGVPQQSLSPCELALTRVQLDEEDSLVRAVAHAKAELGRTFDLTSGALSRHVLLRAGRTSYWVHVAHHIALDGFGFSLFARRVAELYTARVEQRPLPQRGFGRLRAVVDEDRAYHASPAFAADRAYWRERLAGHEGAVTLSERSAFPTGTPLRESTALSHDDKLLLDRVAQEARATWGDVLLALVATLVHQKTRERDLILGLPMMNRIGSAALRVPCMAMNIVPLRVHCPADASLFTLTRAVVEARGGLRTHARYRYEQLRRELGLLSGKRRLFGPVVNVMPFDYDLRFGSIRALAHNVSAGPVEDLSIAIHARSDGQGPRIDIDAHPECYQPTELAGYREWLMALLRELCAAPARPCGGGRSGTSATAREPLLQGPPLRRPARDVVARILEQARAQPHAIALEQGEQRVSYGELARRALALAARLRGEGAQPESLIALALPRSCEAIVGMLAVLRSGAGYLPIDPDGPSERTRAILADARPVLVIARTEDRARLAELSAAPTFALSELEGGGAADPMLNEPAGLAYAIYTSGSTGVPNGVRIERGALAHFVEAALERYELGRGERVLQFAPLQFDASVEEIFLSLCSGSTLVLRSEEMLTSVSTFLRSCAALEIGVLDLPTAFFHELAFALGAEQPLPASVHTVIIGGEAALAERVARFLRAAPHARLFNTYGPTEATVVATAATLTLDQLEPNGPVPIGAPLPGVAAAIVDAEGELVARGEVGELCVLGPTLARGYIDREERERQRFITLAQLPDRPRAYRTGDLVRRDGDALVFVGRVDDELKISGQRVDPREVEGVLLAHPGVREACVIAHALPTGGKRLAAFVALDAPAPSDAALRAHAQGALLPAQVPAAFHRCEQLPRTANGKVDRRALAQQLERASAEPARAILEGDCERMIAEVWREVLGIGDVSREDDFFERGGQSLATIQVANRLSVRLGREIPVPWLFRHPTVRELAAALAGDEETSADALAPSMLDDSVLPADLRPCTTQAASAGAILLTGATGFVGVHLLRELLDREPREIVCLVRARGREEARQRLLDSMRAHGLSTSGCDRVRAFAADSSRPSLGLEPADYEAIAATCDTILHCAASVSLTRGYASVRASNVLATIELLRLASRARPKALHYASTLAVAPGRAVAEEVPETFFPAHPGLRDGYTQSKWASERLLEQAAARGFDIAIYRLARVVGPADPARPTFVNRDDIVFRLLRAGIPAGALPDLQVSESWTPVDYVARALAALARERADGAARERSASAAIFHLAPAAPLALSELFAWVRDYGYAVEQLPVPAFAARLEASADADARATAAFLSLQLSAAPAAALGLGRVRCDNALRAKGHQGITCPHIDRALVHRYLDHCVASGLLPSPSESKS